MTDTDLEQTAELTERGETTLEVSGQTSELLRMAVDKDLDVDKLTALVDLHERMAASQAQQKFNEALSGFQRDCPQIPKTKRAGESGGFAYDYADRATVMKTITPFLAKWGLSLTYDTLMNEASEPTACKCVLRHCAGHENASTVPIKVDQKGRMNDVQKVGSAMEYAMRYATMQALGLSATDADDDGAGAGANVKTIDAEQAANIHALAEEVGNPRVLANVLTMVGVATVEEIPVDRYKHIVKTLQGKLK